jgi:hypothetical protein
MCAAIETIPLRVQGGCNQILTARITAEPALYELKGIQLHAHLCAEHVKARFASGPAKCRRASAGLGKHV